MRSLILLSTTLLLVLSAPTTQARELKSASQHKAAPSVVRKPTSAYTSAKPVSRYKLRSTHSVAHPQSSGPRLGRLTANSRVVARARELIGIPYRRGGTSVADGFDCSGLLVYLFRTEAGMRLPRTTGEMIENGGSRVNREELRPGDAVFFNHNGRGNVSHVGLYIGNNLFIHAPSSGERIRMDSLDNNYWERSYTTARRFNG
ncbi:MAG: C40 family peptidase [Pseudomonas sp.]